jgi:hypothetical protein
VQDRSNSKTGIGNKVIRGVSWKLFGEVGKIYFVFKLKFNISEKCGESLTLRWAKNTNVPQTLMDKGQEAFLVSRKLIRKNKSHK